MPHQLSNLYGQKTILRCKWLRFRVQGLEDGESLVPSQSHPLEGLLHGVQRTVAGGSEPRWVCRDDVIKELAVLKALIFFSSGRWHTMHQN